HIGPIRIDAVATEVRPQCAVELFGTVFHERPQRNQLILSPLRRVGRAALEVLPVTGEEGAEVGRAHESFARTCGSKAPAMTACRMTTGHSKRPRCAPATPTHRNRMATPALKAKRPRTTSRRDPVSLEGRQTKPSARRAIPRKRPSGMPMASGLTPNRSRHGTSGTVRNNAPTMISSHAEAPTTNRGRTNPSLSWESPPTFSVPRPEEDL